MGIDRTNRVKQSSSLIDRIRKSQASLRGRKSKIFRDDIDFEIYRPKAGKHIIDIIPYKAGENDNVVDPGDDTYTFAYISHRIGVNNGIEVICPGMYDKPCPVCEMVNGMDWDTEEDLIKQYKAKKRNLYNVVVHTSKEEKAKGIQVFDVPNFYFESQIVEIAIVAARDGEDETIIDFAHTKKGKSIRWTIKAGKPFDEWKGYAFLDRNYKIDKEIVRQAYCLDELVVIKSYDEIKKILDGHLEEESQEENITQQKEDKKINFSEILRKLADIEDLEELEDLVDDYDLEDHGFKGVDSDNSFEEEKAKLKSFLNKDSKPDDVEAGGFPKDEILAKIKEAEDNDDLIDIVDDYDLEDHGFEEIDEDKDFKDEKKRLRKWTKDFTFIKEYNSDDNKQIETKDLEDMSFEDLKTFSQTPRFSNRIDLEDYEEDDRNELIEDMKNVIDDIPF